MVAAQPAAAQDGFVDDRIVVGRANGFGKVEVAPRLYASFNFRLDTRNLGVRLPGQLRFVDPGTGALVISQTVTDIVVGPDLILVEGTCTVNGVPGLFQMEAFDAGRPAELDNFSICYETAFNASCVAGFVRGGNIAIRLERVPVLTGL
jgi:hypothetical protein